MTEYSTLDIPKEICHLIAKYLCSVDLLHLAQSSAHLRSLFHSFVYRNCSFFDLEHDKFPPTFYTSISNIVVPSSVIYEPSKYSWFENETVRLINIQASSLYKNLTKKIPLSEYPRLEKLLKPRHSYGGNFLIYCNDSPRLEPEFPMKYKLVTTNNLLPAAKSNQHYFEGPSEPIPGIFNVKPFALNCVDLDTRASVTSIDTKIFLGGISLDSISARIFDLELFPNLETASITTYVSTHTYIIKQIYRSLLKCDKLQKVYIAIEIGNNVNETTRLLNELSAGNWKTFKLTIYCIEAGTVKIHLPNVTSLTLAGLEMLHDFQTLPTALESFRFYPTLLEGSIPFQEYNSLLQNVKRVSIEFNLRFTESEILEYHLFPRKFPNLKFLSVRLSGSKHEEEDDARDRVVEIFKFLTQHVPFGDFDIRNPEHSTILMSHLAKRLNPPESITFVNERLADPINSLEQNIRNFVETSSHTDLYIALSRLVRLGNFHQSNEDFSHLSATPQAFNSILFLNILQNLPNLETFQVTDLFCFEEYFSLHRLIKHHKALKTLLLSSISTYSPTGLSGIDDEFYRKLCIYSTPFTREFRNQMDSLVYNPQIGITDVRFDLEALRLNFQRPMDYIDLIEHSQYKGNFRTEPQGKGIAYKMPYSHVFYHSLN